MALVSIDSVIRRITRQLAKFSPPQGFEILSYKRNRSVAVLLLDEKTVLLCERGYEEQEFRLPLSGLQKELKSLIKREFPRSRKLRLYQVAGPEELGQPRKKI